MPASFHGMIHGIATAKDYQSAVRAGILAAGDNCSRGGFIGACVAARYLLYHNLDHVGLHLNVFCLSVCQVWSRVHSRGLGDESQASGRDSAVHRDHCAVLIRQIQEPQNFCDFQSDSHMIVSR